ncbi:MAG: DUF4112 domain-containing protein [Chloroflexota bacterium]|nr:DUF4112 domain-containing protein [Chloroflexota bacterium]
MDRVTRLPPKRDSRDDFADVEVLAWLLDNAIRVPGTDRRIGLDGLLGLIPGLGDLIGAALSLVVIVRARQRQLPRIVVARMVMNVALDLVIGAVPVFGDAFDFGWKANTKNLGLLRKYARDPHAPTREHVLFVVGALAVVVAGIALLVWGLALLLAAIGLRA